MYIDVSLSSPVQKGQRMFRNIVFHFSLINNDSAIITVFHLLLIFSFICMFCKSLFVLLSLNFWPLCCLSFDLRILITLFVSSNSSYWNIL